MREFGVVCQDPPSSVKGGPASSVKDLTASSVQASEKRRYGVRGTCGTFAGKRPPKDEEKLKQFLQDRDEHRQMMQESKGQKRQTTNPQQHYRDFVKAMFPREIEGSGKDRLTRVAAKWKNQQDTMPEKLAQENKSVL